MTLVGEVVQLLTTPDAGDFRTRAVATLTLDLEGIPGDRHRGFTRPAGARERWYKGGTPIRSGRQLTVVSLEELDEVARRMQLPSLDPAWIGANIVVSGIPDLSALPWGSRLFFGDGAALVNEGENAPCRFAGAGIAREYPQRNGLDQLFVNAARHRRGIVATVERAGVVVPGPFQLKVTPQRNWSGELLL